MDVPERSGRDRAGITGSAGRGKGQAAGLVRSSRGSGQPGAQKGEDAVYRKLFDSFDRDRDDKVSPWAVLSRLQGCGLLPDDPRIQEALTGLTATEGASKQISFGQFKDVRYLLAAGADPQPVDRWGGTPLSDAEGSGHTQVAELLRQAVRDTAEAVAV